MDDGEDDVRDPPVAERGRPLSGWAAMLASLPTEHPQTWRLCEALRRLLGADGAAITMAYLSETRTTVCATDDVAAGLENLQEVFGEGPGPEAAHAAEVVIADLGGTETRWPILAQAIGERYGPRRLHAVPLAGASGIANVITFHTRIGVDLAESGTNAAFLVKAAAPALIADSETNATKKDTSTGPGPRGPSCIRRQG